LAAWRLFWAKTISFASLFGERFYQVEIFWMKTTMSLAIGAYCVGVILSMLVAKPVQGAVGTGPSFKGPLGLQLYSLRDQFAKDVPGTLDKVRDMGFKDVELAGTYNMTPQEFKAELDKRGLRAVSAHFPYKRLRDDLDGVVSEAKILGLQYAGTAWIEHNGPFDEKICHEASDVFNKAGGALAKENIKFFCHTHGYEFVPYKDGTMFDVLMAETKPEYVCYEMDVFWIVHAGQDPVALLTKYGDRFQLTHLKGMKDTTPTGLLTGHTDVANDVPVGTGKIDFVPIFRATEKAGVKYHFIEDESPLVDEQIPQTLKYLEQVTW
jgi:sugar phosphate isomerase/epimerase